MSLALSPASPRLESSYATYNNRSSSTRSSFSHDPENTRSPVERSATANLSHPTNDSLSPRADSALQNRHEPLDWATRQEMELVVELRRERGVLGNGADAEHSGQDHDRIDIEMEDAASEHSSEDAILEEQIPEIQHAPEDGHREIDVEMDTTPDAPANVDRATLDHNVAPGDPIFTAPHVQENNILPGDLNQQNSEGVSFVVIPPSNLPPTTEEGSSSTPIATNSLSVAPTSRRSNMPGSTISDISELTSLERTPTPPPNARVVINQPGEGEPSNAHESDGDSSDDDDDEDPYWASFQQDTSLPSEEQLALIAAKTNVRSAHDEEHWKREFFEAVEDPEHYIGQEGKFTWTLKGFHGTPAKPNREKFLRSPQVLIDGLWWNVKVFTRGNDGTDCVSVYIECSNKSRDASSPEEGMDEDEAVDENLSWGSAAQVGCIMFNPSDPKVQYNSKSCHYFCKGNQDWGWVRFHGPWETLHNRRDEHTRPLLQNDSVEIIAYVRTVHDYTRSLWWHSPHENTSEWDNVVKTGYRGMSSHLAQSSALNSTLMAALAPWVHLKLLQTLITGTPVPHANDRRRAKPLPLTSALQSLLTKLKASDDDDSHETARLTDQSISITSVEDAIGWHAWDTDLKERDVLKNADVVRIWEALRHLINLETSNSSNEVEGGTDVLDFISTVRPQMLSGTNNQCALFSIHSTQGILDDIVRGDSKVPWNGFPTQLSLASEAPLVLQVELPRQTFDATLNRWKRSTHKIELNETISLMVGNEAVEYTLYGMVVHAGHLEMASYYSIVRPRGPNSPWMQYARTTQGDIKLLTKKQAIDAHQGTGDSSEGTDPIAYIVMYIRSDALADILPDLVANPASMVIDEDSVVRDNDGPNYLKASYNPVGIVNPWPKESNELAIPETCTIEIFTSEILNGYSDRGFYDIWQLQSQRAKVADLDVSRTTTIRAIRERLVTRYNLAAVPEQCRLWLMNLDDSRSRWSVPLRQYKLDTTLEDIHSTRGVFVMWLHVVPLDTVLTAAVSQSASDDHSKSDVQSPSTADAMPETDAAPSASAPEIVVASGNSAAAGFAMLLDQIQQGRDDDSTVQSLINIANSVELDDVSMGGTRNEPADTAPAEAVVSTRTPTPPLVEDQGAIDDIYVLVKSFDAENQKLKSNGVLMMSKKDRVGGVLERLNLTEPEKTFEIFCDEGGKLRSGYLKARHTFEAEDLRHGTVLVVQEKLSETKKEEIKTRGDCSNVIELYKSLVNLLNPRLAAQQYTRSFFGSDYFDMSLKRGRPHGPCHHISMNDESYVGNFVSGVKEGEGTMKYANGDVYTGQWMDNLPNGQGKREYSETGNVYEGGWKKGKRHGKGVMHYEVADEQENTCAICYEKEVEAVLYRCGHAVSCVECARRLESCPLCRASVEGVTRFLIRRLVL